MEVAYLLVFGLHLSPASSAFISDFLWLSMLPQFCGDQGSSTLHVQEIWRQGTFGGIGIMFGSLAFLLLSGSGLFWVHLKILGLHTTSTNETGLGENICQVSIKCTSATRVEDRVGMVDVGAREILDGRLKGGEGNDDLE